MAKVVMNEALAYGTGPVSMSVMMIMIASCQRLYRVVETSRSKIVVRGSEEGKVAVSSLIA